MESLHGYLERICGPSAVPFGDETWRGLLGIATFLPRDPPGQVDSVVEPYIDDLGARNQLHTLYAPGRMLYTCIYEGKAHK